MKRPVFTFAEEVLTDAPLDHLRQRLSHPADLPSLARFGAWEPLAEDAEGFRLRWRRARWGAQEQGDILVRPDARGAHLRLEGRLEGWSGFLLLGRLRFRVDGLLDRMVAEL